MKLFKFLFLIYIQINIVWGQGVKFDSLIKIEILIEENYNFDSINTQKIHLVNKNNFSGDWYQINKDTIYNNVNLSNLRRFYDLVNSESTQSSMSIIKELKIDSIWLIENYNTLLDIHKKRTGKKCGCMKKKLSNLKKVQDTYRLMGVSSSFSYYPSMTISFVYSDTNIVMHSLSQNYYLLPWVLDNKKMYSPNISILLGDVLQGKVLNEQLLRVNKKTLLDNIVNQFYIYNCRL